MQYTIMMQKIPGVNSVYVSRLDNSHEAFTYTTHEEAQTKLNELQSADGSGRIYMISAYPDEVNLPE